MSRKPSYWFDTGNQAWYTSERGQRVRLADGPKNAHTEGVAATAFYAYMAKKTAEAVHTSPNALRRPLNVIQLFEAYLAHAEAALAPRTYQERVRLLSEFASAHGKKMVSSLIPFDLNSWLASKSKRWLSSDTQAEAVKAVKAPFNWAVKQGLLAANPFRAVTKTFGNRREPASEADYHKVLDHFPPGSRMREVLQFIYHTGCRPSEVRGLRWDNLDVEKGLLVLPKHKTSKTRRDHAPRRIVLTEEPLQILVKIRARKDHDEFIFVSRLRRTYARNSIQQNVTRASKEVGLETALSCYGLRHSYGTAAITAGMSLKVLAELMGHASTRMTEHYVHLAGEVDTLRAQAIRVRGQKAAPPQAV